MFNDGSPNYCDKCGRTDRPPVVAAPVPDWLKKIAEELPVLAAFIRAECGPVGWEHTVNVWAERLQEYVSVPASAEPQ